MLNEETKKKILRQIPYGLYVIGVKDKDTTHAFTASWLSQCSLKPPRVMLGVRHGTHSLDLLKNGKVFSVNFVSKESKKIIEQFFKHTPASGNRFGDLGYTIKKTGAPVLDAAAHYIECEVKNIVDAGDHSIVIGEVVAAEILKDVAPLVMGDTPWHYGS